MSEVIKVSLKVKEALIKIQGFLQWRDGRRYTISDVVEDMIVFCQQNDRYVMSLELEEGSSQLKESD